MTDEEKKAINLLKSYENKLVYEISEKDKKAVKTILNLIEKQQKEIEELKEMNERQQQRIKLVERK
jgi:DNA-binding PadR family transcriptional regulator